MIEKRFIAFDGIRITKGNPVVGQILEEDRDTIEVLLDHRIDGVISYWDKGASRVFTKSMIENVHRYSEIETARNYGKKNM